MTPLDPATRDLLEAMTVPPSEEMPPTEFVVAPATIGEAATVLAAASRHRLEVMPWGGGTHRGIGYSAEPSVIVSTENLTTVVDWQREDLTVVVEAGVRVADLESMLAAEGRRRAPLNLSVDCVEASLMDDPKTRNPGLI